MERLGLSDEELMTMLDTDPLSVITDELSHRPEIGILLDLTAEAEERAGTHTLRAWVRAGNPRPLDLLLFFFLCSFVDSISVSV